MNLLCGLSGIAGIKNPKKGLCNIFEAGYENILLDLKICGIDEESLFCDNTDIVCKNIVKRFEFAGRYVY